MTQDEIIALAREAGFGFMTSKPKSRIHMQCSIQNLAIFENLVAAKERENWPAEMKAMENQVNILTDALANAVKSEREACARMFEDKPTLLFWGLEAARHIRARGEQHG